MKKSMISLLTIILALIIITFPILGIVTAESIVGFTVLLMAMFLIITGISEIDYSPSISILTIAIGIVIFILSLIIIFNPYIFAFLVAITMYLSGILLIIVGLITLIGNRDNKWGFWSGVFAVLLGVIYIVLSSYTDPLILGYLIGIWLILTGVLKLVDE